jgi:cellulose synthase (UDP-forming)
MIPQVLVFVFLALSSVVSIWRDLGNSQFSLATAWSITNTFILGSFIVVAFRESWRNKHPKAAPVEASQPAARQLTTVIVPPALEDRLGLKEAALTPAGAAQNHTASTQNRTSTNGQGLGAADDLAHAETEGASR